MPPIVAFLKEKSAISATSFVFDHFYRHFVIGVTGIDGKADPAGKAETGTVIVGETFGVLLAVSSITSSAYPEVWAMLTLYVQEVIHVKQNVVRKSTNKFFIQNSPVKIYLKEQTLYVIS